MGQRQVKVKVQLVSTRTAHQPAWTVLYLIWCHWTPRLKWSKVSFLGRGRLRSTRGYSFSLCAVLYFVKIPNLFFLPFTYIFFYNWFIRFEGSHFSWWRIMSKSRACPSFPNPLLCFMPILTWMILNCSYNHASVLILFLLLHLSFSTHFFC